MDAAHALLLAGARLLQALVAIGAVLRWILHRTTCRQLVQIGVTVGHLVLGGGWALAPLSARD